MDTVTRYEQLNRITDLHDFTAAQPAEITEFDERLVKRLIGKITVFKIDFRWSLSLVLALKLKDKDRQRETLLL